MKREKNGWKDLNLQTADSDDTRNQAKMKFPILKSGLIVLCNCLGYIEIELIEKCFRALGLSSTAS